jgi:stage V sporulation protein D (sporulation-specific penicillin-binding protein)
MQRYIGRIRVLTAVCVLAALIIVGRLYYLQVMRGDWYARRADAQFVSTQDPLLDRGTIYFTDKDGNQITAATLNSVASSTDHQRYYPGGSLAAQEIGFVAYNNDNTQKGRYGLEKYYDEVLTRDQNYSNFFVELFGGVKTALQGGTAQGDIITTIEPSVQAELERTLVDYDATWHPDLSGGIVMDPKTGEIVAMAVSPTFDLNTFNKQTDPLIYADPMVQNVYEMGSIIKPLTMAAGIDSGAVTEQTTYDDTGCITVDTKKICNYDFKARGVIPMQQVLSQSLNVGASFVATTMGQATQRDYFLNHYKLGEETGIDLPGEVHGLMSNLSAPEQVGYDTASFGQGIAMTPIETVRALATLANGGYLVTPHFVKAITYDTGVTRALGWGDPVQVLKPDTTTTVSRMLTVVVDTALAHGADKLDHYSVAAKTGTAQIADPAGGGYYPDRYLHSFFSYFPSYNARFVIFLFSVYPKGAPYASQTWAPPWHALTQFLINYYQLPPDR